MLFNERIIDKTKLMLFNERIIDKTKLMLFNERIIDKTKLLGDIIVLCPIIAAYSRYRLIA